MSARDQEDEISKVAARRPVIHDASGALVGPGAVLSSGPPEGKRVHVVGGDGVSRERTTNSAKMRRKRQQERLEYWRPWLQAAYNAHPDYSAKNLAQAASRIVKLNGEDKPEYSRRAELTEYYAKLFRKGISRK